MTVDFYMVGIDAQINNHSVMKTFVFTMHT